MIKKKKEKKKEDVYKGEEESGEEEEEWTVISNMTEVWLRQERKNEHWTWYCVGEKLP